VGNPIKKLAGQTAIYGLSSIVGRLANYLLLTPLYTDASIFTTEQFGVVTNTYAWVAVSIIFFTYGMETGYFRFASKLQDVKEKVFSTSLISVFTTAFIFVLLILTYSAEISAAIGYPNHAEYVEYLAIIIGLDAAVSIPFARLRLEEKPIRFAFIRLFSLAINVGLNFFFYVICPWYTENYNYESINSIVYLVYDPSVGVGYVFIANLIASFITFALLSPQILKHSWKFDFPLWKQLFKYCWPLLVVGLAGALNQHFDKLIIKYLVPDNLGDTETGIYGAIYKLSIFITLFIQAFQYAAEPFFFNQAKEKDSKETYAKVLKYFTILTSTAFLGILLFIDVVKHFIRSDEYFQGLYILPWLLMSAVFFGIYYNLSFWYKLSGKTYFGAIISGIGSILTIVGNIFLVPYFENLNPGNGYFGAAITTFGCFLIMSILSYVIGQKHYPVNYDLKRILGYIILAGLLFLTSDFLISDLPNPIKLSINSLILVGYLGIAFKLERPQKTNK
jgi:O-antigen/teichoic acid export membrane protein|tara:strand:- start:4939 stop:6453 length:1515 start_codon:yes stop_codon:yes gene_type:complete